MQYIHKVLKFLQLVDREGNLSITNISTIVVITKIAVASSIDWGVISALLITLLNYGHKRYEANKAVKSVVEPVDMSPIQDALDSIQKELEEVKVVSEDAKDKASKIAIASGIVTKKIGR